MNTVLAAIDNSPRASAVVAFAADYAKVNGKKLVLFRAVNFPSDVPFDALGMSAAQVQDVLLQRVKNELAEVARTVPSAVPCETMADVGGAWQAICHAAQRLDAAIVVIGSHGYGGLDRVLGTTAARVVNHADRTVIVVRPPH